MTPPAPSSKPAILLIHGAWHSPSCWSLLIPHLESAGFTTQTVSLPSSSFTNIQTDFTADVTTITSAITTLSNSGHTSIALLMHSYAGIPGSSAIQHFTSSSATHQPNPVTHLIYLTAFLLPSSVSLADAVGIPSADSPSIPDWWLMRPDNLSLMPGSPEMRFYNDITDPSTLSDLVSQLKPHSKGSFFSKNTCSAFLEVKNTTYIGCEKDNAIPYDAQVEMVKTANEIIEKEGNGKVNKVGWVALDSGHSPMISMPERTAEVVVKILEGS